MALCAARAVPDVQAPAVSSQDYIDACAEYYERGKTSARNAVAGGADAEPAELAQTPEQRLAWRMLAQGVLDLLDGCERRERWCAHDDCRECPREAYSPSLDALLWFEQGAHMGGISIPDELGLDAQALYRGAHTVYKHRKQIRKRRRKYRTIANTVLALIEHARR